MSYKTQDRVIKVLKQMIELAKENGEYAQAFSQPLDRMLDVLHLDDCFGTEGQNDPRGDQRNSNDLEWSMDHVEGID